MRDEKRLLAPFRHAGFAARLREPFGLALCFAAAIHAAVIFGVAFEPQPHVRWPPDRTLEIMVVRHPEPKKEPEEPDFLAQTSQQGGGTEEERVRPTTEVAPPPLPEPLPTPEPEVSVPTPPEPPPPEPPMPEPAPQPEPTPEPPVMATPAPAPKVAKPPKPQEKAPPKKPAPEQKRERKKEVTAADLLASTNAEIERLSAELDRKTEAYAKRPRREFISASTKEYRYAAYMENWRQKVERIGNINYPAEAKKLQIYGSLQLTVVVNASGEVVKIDVDRSSGHKILDDAAINIVRLAAPYSPFPPEIKKNVDELYITRTWQFRNNNQLFSK